MSPVDMQAVLQLINQYDPRRPVGDEQTAIAWLEIFFPVPAWVAEKAVHRYYKIHTEENVPLLMPGHLFKICKEIWAEHREREFWERSIEGAKSDDQV